MQVPFRMSGGGGRKRPGPGGEGGGGREIFLLGAWVAPPVPGSGVYWPKLYSVSS